MGSGSLMCRYDHFFRLPTAHAAINGVLKPFWNLLLRTPTTKLDTGEDVRIPTAVQKRMTGRHGDLVSTSAFDTRLPNVVTCALLAALRWSFTGPG